MKDNFRKIFTFFMKHVKFQVPRQGQYEPVPADREREGEQQRPVDRGESFLTHEWSTTRTREQSNNRSQDASHAGQSVGRNGRRLLQM